MQHPMGSEVEEKTDASGDAIQGAIIPTFFKYLVPSLVGLIAMTSASLVDGFFVGNYVGITALAAVNLILPITTILFGVGMMLSIGGSVRGGKYLGEGNTAAASAIFSKTLVCLTVYGAVVISLGLVFEEQLFAGLGATEALFPVMSEYYRVIMPFLFAQFTMIGLYFFIRLDGLPNLAAAALAVGAVVNILLDYLFIAVYDWGLTGAAFATGISQSIPLLVMLFYFLWPKRRLQFGFRQKNWKEVFQAAYNGISEFINEISGGIIAFIFNWMMIQRGGVDGVAAITVVNYLMMLGFMVFFSISDTVQVMVSQNFGARRSERIEDFLKTASYFIALLSVVLISVLLTMSEPMILLFVDDQNSTAMVAMATEFVTYVWPLFLFAGANMLISGYLTAIHLPFQSGLVALCRGLILPAVFLILFYVLLDDYRFVAALAVAEGLTFALALFMFLRHTPRKALSEE
ncbi:MAG: putative MATE family efflux protein [Candidatus Azotimanducaceae bacterium]|jgi:putative MATE family efflux protein